MIEKKIYRKLLQVPSGKITTYKELARSVGLENGQRVIGQIMKKNPFPVIIPCHRVVKSNGEIGGYAYGISIKKSMLVKEGISIKNNKIKNFQKTFFRF
jgi:methylated-DNA-[protein]-cysteine S-methyltransferase